MARFEDPQPVVLQRSFYKVEWLKDSYGYERSGPKKPCAEAEANLVGSRLRNPGLDNYHAPVIDIDFEAQLLPSRTPGHYHLYLDTPIEWRHYKNLLKHLADVGIVEPGYAEASIDAKESYLRVPAGGETLEAQLLKRALEAEHRVQELETDLAVTRELVVQLMKKSA